MLAKLWKKVLLAICIIACIYNVMSKIVNRHSLEINLESVNDGNTVFNFERDKKEQKDSEVIDGVINNTQVNNEEMQQTNEATTDDASNENTETEVVSEEESQDQEENNTENQKKSNKNVQYMKFY